MSDMREWICQSITCTWERENMSDMREWICQTWKSEYVGYMNA